MSKCAKCGYEVYPGSVHHCISIATATVPFLMEGPPAGSGADNDTFALIEQLRARNEVLERQLAEFQHSEFHPDWSLLQAAQESLREYMSLVKELTERAEQAEQRIAESQRQEPVCWIEADPSAKNESAHNVFGSMIYSTAICVTKPERGNPTWALYATPIVPPTVEEAVKAENECCVKIILAQDVDPAFKNRIADAIRARSGKCA